MLVPNPFEGTETDMIMQCQSFCALAKSCARFTMEVGTRTCRLATRDATPLPGMFNAISGPAVCGPRGRPDIFLQKKFLEDSPMSLLGARTSLATLGASTVSLGVAMAALHF